MNDKEKANPNEFQWRNVGNQYFAVIAGKLLNNSGIQMNASPNVKYRIKEVKEKIDTFVGISRTSEYFVIKHIKCYFFFS